MDHSYAQLELGGFGTLRMTFLADPSTGAVRYRLTAPHVRGSVVLVPALFFADPSVPETPARGTDLYIFARLDNVPTGVGRHERPLTVHGIELAGRSVVNTQAVDAIKAYRMGRSGRTELLPSRSGNLARVVLGAAAEHWSQRDDRPVLDDLARRASAQHFLSEYENELDQREEAVRRAQVARDETQQRISVLRDLVNPAVPACA
ncbi:hypothetical protein [Streptomyces prunicolor]|uniref:hypothetical protein n=1 Tax=Streptomyces prunicolor TaxID=67348 RepID=UPI0003730396|nr:hypothetical protein [Streptomyces prunicolor]